jgi:hypothetical protein
VLAGCAATAWADTSFLDGIHHHTMLASTVPANGDQNPYAIVVAPVSAGKIRQGDVLVDNFNNSGNLQGLGTTIVEEDPRTKAMSVFAAIPRHLPGCPGGVGLTTAMTMLSSGWVIVGSLPSNDGTTATRGEGCLIVLDSQGQVADTIAGPDISGPWGNMAVADGGDHATLFVSNTGFDVGPPVPAQGESDPPTVNEATVLRLTLSIPPGQKPVVTGRTVVGGNFGAQADKDVFVIGPTGLALGPNDTLYVSDAVGNRINAISRASTRTNNAGIGRIVTQDGLLQRPLAMTMAPNGHLLVVNGQNGQVVEIDPQTGKQLAAQWIDANKAQNPPGSGDLFGIAMTPSGEGFYYVEDEVNMLVLAH